MIAMKNGEGKKETELKLCIFIYSKAKQRANVFIYYNNQHFFYT